MRMSDAVLLLVDSGTYTRRFSSFLQHRRGSLLGRRNGSEWLYRGDEQVQHPPSDRLDGKGESESGEHVPVVPCTVLPRPTV